MNDMDPVSVLKRPSAFLPVVMSFGALAVVLAFLAFHGPAPQADEGAAAARQVAVHAKMVARRRRIVLIGFAVLVG